MAQIIIGHKRDPKAEYIGRGSPLGNPFVMRVESQRNKVCDDYEIWFKKQLANKNPEVINELRRLYNILKETGELVLGCYCSPKRCHGETIRRYLLRKLELARQAEVMIMNPNIRGTGIL